MKRIIVSILLITLLLSFFTITAEAKQTNGKTNWQITKDLCRKSGYKKIRLIKSNELTDKQFWRIVERRKGKSYIIVEKIVSVSDGTGHGWYSTKTKGTNYIIGYNRKVPKGKTVTSYVIWNPTTNYEDDVLYVVDNKTWR